MQLKNIAKLESIRLLAVATQVFGYESSLETLRQEALSRRTTAETREEIAFLIEAVESGESADKAVVINVVDNLIEKLEDGKFDGALGFMWLEGLASNLNEGAKALYCVAAVVVLQVIAGLFVFNSPFRNLPTFELIVQACSLVVLVGAASVIAAWGWSLRLENKRKTNVVFVGYFYPVAYAFLLYEAGLNGLDFNHQVFGAHWLIIWATFIPALVPFAIFVFKDREGEIQHTKYKDEAPIIFRDPIQGSYEERLKNGITHLQQDIRIMPDD